MPDVVRVDLQDEVSGGDRVEREFVWEQHADVVVLTVRPQVVQRVFRVARIWLVIYAATVAACFALGSILPLMVIGLPRMYGAWHHLMTGLTQHGGLADNVLDHRLNSRTVYMNPISRFVCWNMNYHVEHHMFPMVPFHKLPELHEEMKDDCVPASPSIAAAFAEFGPVLIRQLSDPEVFIDRRPQLATYADDTDHQP